MKIDLPDFDGLVTQVTEEVTARIRRRTPVKTGQARAGWESYPGKIWNDVPYINRLEHGWSDQAPEGMVAITLEEVPDIISDFLKDY